MSDLLHCPYCRREHQEHAGAEPGDQPDDGSVSLCYGCGLLSFFVGTPPTALRKPTPEELTHMLTDSNVQAAIAAFHGWSEQGVGEVVKRYREAVADHG